MTLWDRNSEGVTRGVDLCYRANFASFRPIFVKFSPKHAEVNKVQSEQV